ncbi:hypothetical protein DQ384_05140 [Sphaerisporangium album]|uniref:Uncharacterized protein n=1 Tax=Sphaerisporangium album TaxID=509200 RepID=A0A367FQG7_9ACTN|nr:hypothetical protein [Sphaerisporangium album]RCG31930.1 hypothetical protein DQ384_05140 [Sphaerisporangium album]
MSVPHAVLAYGYNLGGSSWNIAEKDEYGSPAVPWYNPDHGDFIRQAEAVLLAAAGVEADPWDRDEQLKAHFGLKFERYVSWDDAEYMLAAHVISTDWEKTEELDLAALITQAAGEGWDDKLRAAVGVLGITPEQEQPQWVLCAYQS